MRRLLMSKTHNLARGLRDEDIRAELALLGRWRKDPSAGSSALVLYRRVYGDHIRRLVQRWAMYSTAVRGCTISDAICARWEDDICNDFFACVTDIESTWRACPSWQWKKKLMFTSPDGQRRSLYRIVVEHADLWCRKNILRQC